MKTDSILALATLLTLPLMTGCQTQPPVHKITDADNGSTILLSRQDLLEVDLAGNPSTGYTWQTVNLNSWVLAPLGRPVFNTDAPGTNDPPVVGGGGLTTLTYRPVGEGTSPLQLAYSRPWQTNATPAKTFAVTITVK